MKNNFIEYLPNRFSRIIFYFKRRRLVRLLFLKFFKGYKIINNRNNFLIIKNLFDNTLFKFPDSPHYLSSVDPNNELLVDSYINIQDGIFIDIGAYIGKYSIKIGMRPNVKVIAIEPNPESFNILLENVSLNKIGLNFIPINKAVYEGNKPKLMLQNNYSMSKILENRNDNFSFYEVETTTLHDLFKAYNVNDFKNILIKVDVEGYEYPIITSLLELLDRKNNFRIIFEILIETENKEDLINRIKKTGLKFIKIDSVNYLIDSF